MEPGVKRAREEGEIEVVCNDGTVYVLDAEAAARSEFFAASAAREMREAGRVVVLGDSERVGQIVAFLRRGRVPNLLDVADAAAILELADFFGVHALAVRCLEWMEHEVDECTALSVFLLAAPFEGRGGARASSRAARLVGRALGLVMRTREFLELGAEQVEAVLGDAAMVPLVRQMRLEAGLAWAAHEPGRAVPAAATRMLVGLPSSVVSALLQSDAVLGAPEVVRALGAGLTVAPRAGMRANDVDFAVVIFAPCGRVVVLDVRTRETHDLPPIPRAGGPCAAVYDRVTRKALVFQLESHGAPYEYCLESGTSRALECPLVPKVHAAYVAYEGAVYCIGGETSRSDHSRTVARLRPGGQWEPLEYRMCAARSAPAATMVGSSLVVVGGNELEDQCGAERLDLSGTGGWEPCEVRAQHRTEHAVACIGLDVFVVGGAPIFDDEDRGSFVFDVDETDPREVELAPVAAPRALAVRGDLWVFGTTRGGAPNVQIYDPELRGRQELYVPEFTRGSGVVFVPRAA